MKKYLSLLLCMVLILSVFAGCGEEEKKDAGHTHCICGGKLEGHACTKTTFQPLSQATFDNVTAESTPVGLHNDTVYRLDKGSYYLTENIAVAEQILIFDEVDICLNGMRLAATHSPRTGVFSRIFAISGGNLDICDCCSETGQGNIQGSYVNQGGAILIQGRSGGAEGDLGTVTLYSGIIKGGRAQSGNGGTVSVIGGTFRMYGGEVTGGAAKQNGGNVYVGAQQTVELLGGNLTDGLANYGSCIYAEPDANVILGGSLTTQQLYLPQGATIRFSEDVPVTEGFSVPVTMELPGVFAQEVNTDLSAFFPGATYDPNAKTLAFP